MGLIDKLRKASGIVKNRLASAVGALRGITVGGARSVRGVRFAARATRLTTPTGIALTAATFAPEIVRAGRVAARGITRAIGRGTAFFAGRQVTQAVVGGAAAGIVAGGLSSRRSGGVTRPSDFGDPSLQSRPRAPSRPRAKRRKTPNGRTTRSRKRKTATRRTRKVRSRKRRTHRSPRHKGHTRVSFTTRDGQKVKFLAAKTPAGRHR